MRGFLVPAACRNAPFGVADSFVGLPSTKTDEFPLDQEWTPMTEPGGAAGDGPPQLAVFDLLDEQVKFLPGWFADTLPGAPHRADHPVLRLDGDPQESTWSALEASHDRVAPGGFVIIDDYVFESCRQAVEDFRLSGNRRSHPARRLDRSVVAQGRLNRDHTDARHQFLQLCRPRSLRGSESIGGPRRWHQVRAAAFGYVLGGCHGLRNGLGGRVLRLPMTMPGRRGAAACVPESPLRCAGAAGPSPTASAALMCG